MELTVGLALCATTQIEQETASVRLGWLWVDSAATVHNIKDRHSQADHFPQKRITNPRQQLSRFGIRLCSAYKGYPPPRNSGQVTIEGVHVLTAWAG